MARLKAAELSAQIISVFRDANWLTPERAWRWGLALAALWLTLIAADCWRHTAAGVTDQTGEQLARDFVNYWSGARAAARGQAALAYNVETFWEFQRSLVGPASEFKIYGYPPITMLLCLPMAGLSFLPALCLWTAAGVSLCATLLSRIVGWRIALVGLLAAPAVFFNIIDGQNGFFTAAILAGGLLLLRSRPILAGVAFGLIAYKPQLGVLLPIALAAGGQWRAIIATGLSALLLVVFTVALFGTDCWTAFADQMVLQRHLMEEGASFWHRMPTTFAMVREFGAGIEIAYGLQVASSVIAAAAIAFIWRSSCTQEIKTAGLLVATFLATPYGWDYDMVVLVFAAAWLVAELVRGNGRPWQRIVPVGLVLLPALMALLASATTIQAGPVVLMSILIFIAREARNSAAV